MELSPRLTDVELLREHVAILSIRDLVHCSTPVRTGCGVDFLEEDRALSLCELGRGGVVVSPVQPVGVRVGCGEGGEKEERR